MLAEEVQPVGIRLTPEVYQSLQHFLTRMPGESRNAVIKALIAYALQAEPDEIRKYLGTRVVRG